MQRGPKAFGDAWKTLECDVPWRKQRRFWQCQCTKARWPIRQRRIQDVPRALETQKYELRGMQGDGVRELRAVKAACRSQSVPTARPHEPD